MSAGPVRRGNIFWAVVLITIGVVAFLNNFGLLSQDFWSRLTDAWPVALVALGAALVARSLTVPPIRGPLVIAVLALGAIAVILYAYLAPPALRPRETVEASGGLVGHQAGRLDLFLGAADVNVHGEADTGRFYHALFDYPAGQTPEARVSGDTVSIQERPGRFFAPSGRRRADIALNATIPWEISLGTGASSERLELAGLQLRRLDISGGASRLEASLPQPDRSVLIQVSGGASGITIHRPGGVPIRVDVTGGASNLDVDGRRFGVVAGSQAYESPEYAEASGRYDIQVSGGATRVTIDSR